MPIADGFPGQRLRVLPRPLVRSARTAPITSRLLVTDAGYFPRARDHGRARPQGAGETVLILCADGAGVVRAGGVDNPVRTGQAVLLRAGQPHSYRADDADPWTIWWLHLTGTDVDEFVDRLCGAAGFGLVDVQDMLAATDVIGDVIRRMEADETTASLYEASGAAWQLLARLAADVLRGPAPSRDRIRMAQEHLQRHPEQPVSVPDLAQAANLSVSHFSTLFRAATGTTVLEYVRSIRMGRARELLVTTDATIAEAGAIVGYADAFYFARQFRVVHGMSPSEFRRSARRGLL